MKSFIITITITILLLLCGLVFADNAEGTLEIVNVIYGAIPGRMFIIHSDSDTTDGFDGEPPDFEVHNEDLFSPLGYAYSQIPDHSLLYDERSIRDENDIDVYMIKFKHIGYPANPKPNHLAVNFYVPPYQPFGGKPIILWSDLLAYGQFVDVRMVIEAAIEANNPYPQIDLIDLPAGLYDIWSPPYGEGILIIGGEQPPPDATRDGKIDLEDFAVLADEWQLPQGKYRSDFTGADCVPDGYVDCYDLAIMANNWLRE